jgi:predicted DNA primase small subunit
MTETTSKKDQYEMLSAKLNQYNQYYSKFFDVNQLWRVIKHDSFDTREFGFERGDIKTDSLSLNFTFSRNKSFKDPEDLTTFLGIFNIGGAYIGALYDDPLSSGISSKDHVSIHDTKWLGRELIFDLDLNEYDPVRFCGCKGRDYCEYCWGLLQDASIIIEETLREDFGFKKLEWVFTGGRGYHCWVLDEEVFDIPQETRSGIVHYMQLINDPLGEQRIEPIGDTATPLKERIYKYLIDKFIDKSPKEVFKEINIGEKALSTLKDKYKKELFNRYSDLIPTKSNEEDFLNQMIKYYYPRIDHKVTIDTRRLIRMPGSIHGRTGLISQFIDKPEKFYPHDAKTINDLVPLS